MRAVIMATTAILLTGALGAGTAGAQQSGFKRTVLQQGDLSVAGHESVTAVAEFQPGGTVGRHTHPGEEVGYILEGTIILEQDGKPPVTLGPGKTFFIPAGTIHNATNRSTAPARVLANYIVEKGKPLATPASK
ncbi:MAG TPA: cupin domain-containing protein [Vicinamibacterales bacterium]|nr:cupin domain-containing protein [Vicinamibacterales bacterium]